MNLQKLPVGKIRDRRARVKGNNNAPRDLGMSLSHCRLIFRDLLKERERDQKPTLLLFGYKTH